MNHRISRRRFLKSLGVAAASHGLGLTGLSGLALGWANRVRAQELPRLVYLFPGPEQPDTAQVQQALSAYMAERIGATIELRAIEPEAYDSTLAQMNDSAARYDVAFTSLSSNNFHANVSRGYLASLDDLLPDHAPGYMASMTPATWNAARVGERLYGAINQHLFVKQFGPYIRKDVMDAIGLDDEFRKMIAWEQLETIFAAIHEYVQSDEKLTHVTYDLTQVMTPEAWNFDPQETMLVVSAYDETAEALIFSETVEYRQAAEMVRRWTLAGYVPTEPMSANMDSAWQEGLYAVRVAEVVRPGIETEVAARWGHPIITKAFSDPVLTTDRVLASMNGVSATSQHPDLAMKFLELVNTDPVFYNMLCKGIEDVHWEWADRERRLIRPADGKASFDETGYNLNADGIFGNVFNAYYTDDIQTGSWPASAELNRTATPSPVLGFVFDRTPVQEEITAVAEAAQEYATPLSAGTVEVDEGINELNQVLTAAGIERVRAELQKQINAWRATRDEAS